MIKGTGRKAISKKILPVIKNFGGVVTHKGKFMEALGYSYLTSISTFPNHLRKALESLKRKGIISYDYTYNPSRRPVHQIHIQLLEQKVEQEQMEIVEEGRAGDDRIGKAIDNLVSTIGEVLRDDMKGQYEFQIQSLEASLAMKTAQLQEMTKEVVEIQPRFEEEASYPIEDKKWIDKIFGR
jgi:hypothetical protein